MVSYLGLEPYDKSHGSRINANPAEYFLQLLSAYINGLLR